MGRERVSWDWAGGGGGGGDGGRGVKVVGPAKDGEEGGSSAKTERAELGAKEN